MLTSNMNLVDEHINDLGMLVGCIACVGGVEFDPQYTLFLWI